MIAINGVSYLALGKNTAKKGSLEVEVSKCTRICKGRRL